MNDPDRRLDDRLREAHEADDVARLIALYTEAADRREADGEVDAACFYLTHAFVYALQAGDPAAELLQRRLWTYGREMPPG